METRWIAGQQNRITFVMIDATGTEVVGIGSGNLSIEISENAGAFGAALGTDIEIGNGWYSYLSDATEGATIGDTISIRVNGAGAIQQNLEYVIQQRTPLAVDFTYTITNSVTTNPIDGVITTISTDLAGSNIIWRGVSDSFGVTRDTINGQVPYLDVGTYYFRNRRTGFVFSNPDTEIITVIDNIGEVTGTPVSGGAVTTVVAAPIPESCVTLKRYAEIIGYPQCNFFGVNADINTGFQCQEIWTRFERDNIARYLAEAQEEIEREVGYPLCARWIGENESQLWHDKQSYKRIMISRFSHIIESGIKVVDTIQADATVDHSSDPAIVGPIATTVTDVDEVHVFYPNDSDRVIYTFSKTITGGNLTIEIERCHLVDPDFFDNPSTGLAYNDLTNFLGTIDVKRIYNSIATEATLIYPKCNDCDETTKAGCIYITNSRVGIIEVRLNNGTGLTVCGCGPRYVNLNYKAGLEVLSQQAEDTIVRLAHSKMPQEPCGCDVVKRLWGRDRNIPDALTRERLNCPFGLSDGAWTAWQFAQSMKIMRSSVL